ncbi:putative Calcium/calmodulin-dependent protein kinase type II alpha chain [Blattamonas nauphoetae]|uniref:Calcium/calmodulin-dependent protein kinase type II alpha chain n=1 Tax=Blattamonas nauphoetae TaxID=2049346 RepID=A0ABQ9Y957_9EUKA|nr:putative Calcium/calmodulin-dependent protein kinase type II alpha chain [Blattamonas nauphoetae]
MTNVIEVPDGYSFVKPISSGGFGSVVEMIENSTQEHYAGKMIPCVTPKDTERIDREVNRLRKFAHPGIVKLKEVATMGNMKVIVMELGGQSLSEIVKDYTSRKALMPRDVVYRVMVDIASALAMMHSEEGGRTAHGDVKLENILLFAGGAFKLCDLGAAESEDVSSTRSVMSQLYVSPERMESETGKATCSSDVWALGIVLHWLLFGEPPFKSQNAARLFREIGSFKVSMIGESCGGEERALLMRMLDPNPETRVTSTQLCSFGMFRCIVNTTSALWVLKDADEKTLQDAIKKILEMEAELTKIKEKLAKSESVRIEAQAQVKRLEQRQFHQPQPPPQVGAAAIAPVDSTKWTVSGNVFTKKGKSYTTLLSSIFGTTVARLSFTIRAGPNNSFAVGIISSSLRNKALTFYFPNLKGGAGWELHQDFRYAIQNNKLTNEGSACLSGRKGQRVVLEADGREGKRTLKMSQDGQTQQVFFTNIPVPFKFAVYIFEKSDAVEIESVEVVREAQMVGGTIAVKMDE